MLAASRVRSPAPAPIWPRLGRQLATAAAWVTPLLVSATAAAEGGESGDHHAHVANWWDPMGEANAHAPALGWVMVTFAIFVGIVFRFARGPLQAFVKTRHDDVRTAIEEARRAKEEAEAKKREFEEKLQKLDDEVAALKKDFEERGRAEMARLEEAGKRTAERIKKDAEDTIAADTERAHQELRAEAARLALELAEQKIAQAVTAADENRLRDSFLDQLAN